jgi:hypothetical protein
MTVLGVNLTDTDPAYTWADIKPSRRPVSQEILDARAHSEACWREWLRLADLFEEGQATYEEVEEAFAIAAEAEDVYHRLKQEQTIVIL